MDRRRVAAIAVLCVLAVPMAILTVRSATSGHASTSSSGTGDVKVTGAFGQKPTLTVPATDPPKGLKTEALSTGSGEPVVTGKVTMVVNYLRRDLGREERPAQRLRQLLRPQESHGVPDRHRQRDQGLGPGAGRTTHRVAPAARGSRPSSATPPTPAAGTGSTDLVGHTLLFVVDIIDTIEPDAAATGAVMAKSPGRPAEGELGVRQAAGDHVGEGREGGNRSTLGSAGEGHR